MASRAPSSASARAPRARPCRRPARGGRRARCRPPDRRRPAAGALATADGRGRAASLTKSAVASSSARCTGPAATSAATQPAPWSHEVAVTGRVGARTPAPADRPPAPGWRDAPADAGVADGGGSLEEGQRTACAGGLAAGSRTRSAPIAIGTRPRSTASWSTSSGPARSIAKSWCPHDTNVGRCQRVPAWAGSRASRNRRWPTCPPGPVLPGQRVDERHPDQDAEHAERHPPTKERGHRAGSGTGTVARSDTTGTEVTRTRGRRCDSWLTRTFSDLDSQSDTPTRTSPTATAPMPIVQRGPNCSEIQPMRGAPSGRAAHEDRHVQGHHPAAHLRRDPGLHHGVGGGQGGERGQADRHQGQGEQTSRSAPSRPGPRPR